VRRKRDPEGFAALLLRAHGGEPAAIAQLWVAHQPALIGWLRSTCGPSAEDIASEAWISAFSAVQKFSGDERQFRTWLFTLARRRLEDSQRREIGRPAVEA
jgi:RNA polymerase sigma-70 factor (ECF subfamily)